MVGTPISYTGEQLDAMLALYKAAHIYGHDTALEKKASVFGHAFELVYAKPEGQAGFAVIDPRQAFLVVDDSVAVSYTHLVSGGQKQRLCIARALLKKPKILILDDSTSAVDTKTDALIRKAFREELPGTTKFIIAQRISSVQDADKIIVMDGGKVNGFGDHETLLQTNPIYREVWESQMKGGQDDEETKGLAE